MSSNRVPAMLRGLACLAFGLGADPLAAQTPDPLCVHFTYNAQGNRTKQETFDPSAQEAEWNLGRYGCFRWTATPFAEAPTPKKQTELAADRSRVRARGRPAKD